MTHQNCYFPLCPGAGSTVTLQWSTKYVETGNGCVERVQRWAVPRRVYVMEAGDRSGSEIQDAVQFFLARSGGFETFLLEDWCDYKSALGDPDTSEISETDQVLGFGDDDQVQFQLLKNYSDPLDTDCGLSYTRCIEHPVEGTVEVAVGGTLLAEGVDYTVDYETGVVTFNTAPALGLEVTAGFEFAVRVSFATQTDLGLQVVAETSTLKDATFVLIEDKCKTAPRCVPPTGGANVQNDLQADVTLSLESGLLQCLAPTVPGVCAILPPRESLPCGQELWTIINKGVEDLVIKDDEGTVLVTLAPGQGADIGLTEDTAGQKIWWALV